MAILRFNKDVLTKLSLHFSVPEFPCPCPQCTETKIDSDLIDKLEALRSQTGPLRIDAGGGYRCSHYQTELRLRGYETAVGVSQHELGRAADVKSEDSRFTGAELENMARKAGFMAVGVGKDWIHVDLRSDKERRWVYAR